LAKEESAPMKTIQAFVTDDGKLFPNEQQAAYHEMFLNKQQVVEDFLTSDLNVYLGQAQKSIARNTIINWELWKAKNVK
jgi:hypothetical protein